MADVPLINGIRYDFGSIQLMLDGDLYISVKSISYNDSCTGGKIRGTHPQPLGRTGGEYEATASIELFKHSADELRQKLGNGFMFKVFEAVVNYAPAGQPVITDRIMGCRISKQDTSPSQGTDGVTEKIDLDPMKIIWNGVDPIPNPIY